MKTRNTEQKSDDKNDGKNSNKSKPKTTINLNISSTERVCNRCKIHDNYVSIKGHKCVFSSCDCLKCKDYEYRKKKRHETAKKRLNEKKANNESSVADNSFVKALKAKTKLKILTKNKSIELLNKKVENKDKVEENNKIKKRIAKNPNKNKKTVNEDNEKVEEMDVNDSRPPELVPEIPLSKSNQKSSTSLRNEELANEETTDSYPIRTSAAVCAQYLKAGEELSRKLSKCNLTEDELMGCLKYSLISYCLGDVEMAAQKIIFASNEIRSGALYNIQHPNEEPINNTTNNPSTSLTTVPNVALNSTFNVNFRPNPINYYNPTFTPIHN